MFAAPEKRYSQILYDYAMHFRSIAMLIDHDPSQINKYLHLKAIDFLLSDRKSTTFERTKYLEALSYGDPGVLLASPGPSLSGLAVRELGKQDQIDAFYTALKRQKMHTFFGLTEIDKGSDAANLKTKLDAENNSTDNYFLTGTKCFCGNVAVAKTGVIFARVDQSIAGIQAILLTPDLLASSDLVRATLPHTVLKGASLGYVTFNRLKVSRAAHFLGNHLSPVKRGLLSITKVFNKLRTGVGAIAIGQAQALLDYVLECRSINCLSNHSTITTMMQNVHAARLALHHAAKLIDVNAYDGVPVSIAKVQAIKITEDVITNIFKLMPVPMILESPWLCKVFRDRYCWEFMEGTSDVLMQHVKNNISGWFN